MKKIEPGSSWKNILLCVIVSNKWIRACEVHEECGKEDFWPQSTRRILHSLASPEYGLLDKRVYKEHGDDLYYEFKTKKGFKIFKKIFYIFIGFKGEEFAKSDYFRKNSRHILKAEEEYERKIEVLDRETEKLLKEKETHLAELQEPHTICNEYLSAIKSLVVRWQEEGLDFWYCITDFCKSCSLTSKCTKRKIEKYDDRLIGKQLEYSINKDIPGQILVLHCYNSMRDLEKTSDEIQEFITKRNDRYFQIKLEEGDL